MVGSGREPPCGLADADHARDQGRRLRLGDDRPRPGDGVRADDLPQMASPAGLLGQPLRHADRRRDRVRADVPTASLWRDDHRWMGWVRVAVGARRRAHGGPDRHRVFPGRPGSAPVVRETRDRLLHRPLRVREDVSGGRRTAGRGLRPDPRRGVPADGVPLVHPERGLPRRLSEGQHRAPRRDRSTWRGDPGGGAGAARTHGARDQAGRAGGIGRFHPPSPQGRGRPRHVSVREALREESRTCRSLVQAVEDRAVRLARGRGFVPVRPAIRGVRGLHAATDDG